MKTHRDKTFTSNSTKTSKQQKNTTMKTTDACQDLIDSRNTSKWTLRRTWRLTAIIAASVGITLFYQGRLSAALITSFEGSEYIVGDRLSTVSDSQTGTSWTVFTSNGVLGANLDAIATNANPAQGLKNVRLVDNNAAANLSTRLNLASAMPLTSGSFTISFDLALTNIVGTDSSGIILLGDDTAFSAAGNNWVYLGVNGSTASVANSLSLNYRTTAGGSPSAIRFKNSDGSNYQFTDGTYTTLSFTINGATQQYTSISVNGQEQLGLATIPSVAYVPAAAMPGGSTFQFYTTSSATGIMDVDVLHVIPEPSSAMLLVITAGLALFLRNNRAKDSTTDQDRELT